MIGKFFIVKLLLTINLSGSFVNSSKLIKSKYPLIYKSFGSFFMGKSRKTQELPCTYFSFFEIYSTSNNLGKTTLLLRLICLSFCFIDAALNVTLDNPKLLSSNMLIYLFFCSLDAKLNSKSLKSSFSNENSMYLCLCSSVANINSCSSNHCLFLILESIYLYFCSVVAESNSNSFNFALYSIQYST